MKTRRALLIPGIAIATGIGVFIFMFVMTPVQTHGSCIPLHEGEQPGSPGWQPYWRYAPGMLTPFLTFRSFQPGTLDLYFWGLFPYNSPLRFLMIGIYALASAGIGYGAGKITGRAIYKNRNARNHHHSPNNNTEKT